MNKICKFCKETKSIEFFVKHKKCKDGVRPICKECYNTECLRSTIKEYKPILCRECNKETGVKSFSKHLKIYHNIEFKIYVKQHIKDFEIYHWTMCMNCNKELAKTFGSKKYYTCSRKCNMEYRAKLWKETKHPRSGKSFSKESRQKMSKSMKEYYKDHSHPLAGKNHSEQSKQKMSNSALERVASPDYKNPMQGKTHTPEAIAKIIKRRPGTTPELLAAKTMMDNGIEFRKQYYLTNKETKRTYAYDFQIKNTKILIEVDGDFWHGGPGVSRYTRFLNENKQRDLEKNELAAKLNFKLIRIWESELNSNSQILIDRIKNA